MEENTRVVEASNGDEFSSVAIPIFVNSVVTDHGCQEVPDPLALSPTETENILPADSMSEASEFSIAVHESPSSSPHKRTT